MSSGIRIPKHTLLNDGECQLIHAGSCQLLSEAGIEIESQEAIQTLTGAGAKFENGRVRIPPQLVEQALAQTARRIRLGAQQEDNGMLLDFDSPSIHFGTGGQALYVLDYEGGNFTRRPAVTKDLVDIVRICEQLENVDFITRPVEPDVPEEEMDLEKTKIFLEHTTKHINLANLVHSDRLPDIIDTVRDKRRISFISCLTVSPMKLVSPAIEKFSKIIEHDIPVAISSCPQAGTTAPLSEIGELIQVNAEILSAIVLANQIKPGAKLLYRGIPISSDLLSDGSPRWCQPESIRRIALVSDMTYFYQIPCCGTAAVSDEKEPNAQNIAEKTISWVFEAASGAQFINSAFGMLEKVLTVSPEQYIIDNEIISKIKQRFQETPDHDIREMALNLVEDALNRFDINMDSVVKQDVCDRIDAILNGQEEYTEENIDAQVDLIGKATASGKSSTVFMKAARSGLRKGWLYRGKGIDSELNLEAIHQLKKQLLSSNPK